MGGVVRSGPASLREIELGSYPFARIRGELSAGAWEQLMNAGEDARAARRAHPVEPNAGVLPRMRSTSSHPVTS